MEKIKNFVKMNKKVLIPVLAVLIILLAGAAVSAAVNLDHAEDGGLKPTEQKEEVSPSRPLPAPPGSDPRSLPAEYLHLQYLMYRQEATDRSMPE